MSNEDSEREFPFEITEVDDESNEALLRDMTGERRGWLRVGPKGYCLPYPYKRDANTFYNFPVRETDTWVVTFPRSGTTLTQEMVWLIANNFDFKASFQTPLVERFPFLEYHLFMHQENKEMFQKENEGHPDKIEVLEKLAVPGYEILNKTPEPRFIKTHLPLSLLPPNILKSKVIYVGRNAKDVCVSYYHLLRLMRTSGYIGNFEQFWHYFETSLVPWAPYFDHIDEGWKLRHEPNLLFMFYEDIIKDMPKAIKTVAKFLNKPCTEKNIEDLCNHLDISNFRNNPSVNFDVLKQVGVQADGEQTFVRKGQCGSSKQEYSKELLQRANKWIEQNQAKMEWKIPDHQSGKDKQKFKEDTDKKIMNNNNDSEVKSYEIITPVS